MELISTSCTPRQAHINAALGSLVVVAVAIFFMDIMGGTPSILFALVASVACIANLRHLFVQPKTDTEEIKVTTGSVESVTVTEQPTPPQKAPPRRRPNLYLVK
ncbi:hypothetical protein L4C42_10210 [Vibrio wakamikoensis]|jgi:flagellar biosynthesis component FlhA|uniref:Uncharacterized protein n=1 Tax=Vibrio chaetopteri TaxID=3016528 RepID=A0AAU8BRH7_9VIBR